MSHLQLPKLLNALVLAGRRGLALSSPSDEEDVRLCRAWGMDIVVEDGTARLRPDPDILVPAWIENETAALAWDRLIVEGYFQITSTNNEAIDRAQRGAPAGLLIYAEQQTAGRGRQLRRWNSPARAGLYFSMVLRPQEPLQYWPLLTHVSSIALVRALEGLPKSCHIGRPLALDIKWPNDVLISGRKTAGILLETTSTGEGATSAVIGVGINLTAEAIPTGQEAHATAVNVEAGTTIPRRWLLVQFLIEFQRRYMIFEAGGHEQILEEWKSCSTMWDGTAVEVIEGARVRSAVTCGLTESGALRIRTDQGQEETVFAADVSIRRR